MSPARLQAMKNIRLRRLKDLLATRWMLSLTVFCALLLVLVVAGLLQKSWGILSVQPLNRLLFSSGWSPPGEFGMSAFMLGTIWVTSVAMLIAVPLSVLTAVYLAEYAPGTIRGLVKPLLDVLAGIPSVVYGLFGLLVIVPLVREFAAALGVASNGYNVLSGAIVLAIMVFPITISISEEVIRTVPVGIREASMALGAPNGRLPSSSSCAGHHRASLPPLSWASAVPSEKPWPF